MKDTDKKQFRKGQIWLYETSRGLFEVKITNTSKAGFIQYKQLMEGFSDLFLFERTWVEAGVFSQKAKALIKE